METSSDETLSMEALGDYQIIKEMGAYDFVTIYLAEHRFLKQKVALKVFSEGLVDASFIERLEKEVHALSKLEHPSIVKIHNVCFASGKYFLVTDPIVDESDDVMHLDRYLDLQEEVLSESQIEHILLEVASALDYAHSACDGEFISIHGALKLTNILIRKEERFLRVFLSDFGIMQLIGIGKCLLKAHANVAKSLDVNNSEKKYKHYRAHLRDFYFLAPEQKRSFSKESLDSKSDAYAFGVLAYYLLTKEFPEGIVEPTKFVSPGRRLPWDLLIRCCLDKNLEKRPESLVKAMKKLLQSSEEKKPSLEESADTLFPWKAIEKKVEDKMQMSFAFDKPLEKEKKTSYQGEVAPSDLKPVIKAPKIERPKYESDPGAVFQRELSVSRYEPTKIEIKEIEPIFSEMAIIPGGTYFRGSNSGARDETPRHAVILGSFAIDIHPVTNEQFVRFLLAMGGEKDAHNNDILRLRDSRIKKQEGTFVIESGYQKHPAVGITWYGASAYASWLGKRLPTEAEWEVAASGGKNAGTYPTGDTIERTQANFFSSDTTSVMSYPPGFFSLYDMAGNVYEWCEDWYSYNYYDSSVQEPENPKGPLQGVYRVLRGGCWKSLKEDLRYSHRHRNNPGAINRTYGFRCAADVD